MSHQIAIEHYYLFQGSLLKAAHILQKEKQNYVWSVHLAIGCSQQCFNLFGNKWLCIHSSLVSSHHGASILIQTLEIKGKKIYPLKAFVYLLGVLLPPPKCCCTEGVTALWAVTAQRRVTEPFCHFQRMMEGFDARPPTFIFSSSVCQINLG